MRSIEKGASGSGRASSDIVVVTRPVISFQQLQYRIELEDLQLVQVMRKAEGCLVIGRLVSPGSMLRCASSSTTRDREVTSEIGVELSLAGI